MTHTFRIQYVTVTCDVCQETRFAEEPTCECEEGEEIVDVHVRRRRRLIWHAAPETSGGSARKSARIEPDGELLGRCSALLDDLMTSFRLVADERWNAASRLRSALGVFRDLSESIRSSTRFRPWLGFWRAIDDSIGNIEEVASRYIGALTAGTASEAERLSDEAQAALDRAAENLAAYSGALDQWNQIDDTMLDPMDVLPSLASAASAVNQSSDIVDLDRRGSALFERVTGQEPADPGLGVGMVITDFVASVIYDSESLWSKAEIAYKILASDRRQLVSLLENEPWRDDYIASVTELRDAATEAAALSAAATNERIEVRATVRLGARLFEPIARPLLVPLLAIAKGRSVERLTSKDPNVAVTQMRQAGFGELVEGLHVALRDADAHHSYTLESDRVLLTSTRAEYAEMTRAQLLDSVLTGMETLHSLYFALTCAFVTAGISIEDLPDAGVWSFSEMQQLSVVLGASGWSNIRVSRHGATVEATGTGSFPTNPTSLGGACLPSLPPDVMTLVLRATGDGTHELEMDVQAFRDREQLQDSWEREVAFIKACSRSSYDSQPIFSQHHVRKWIAMKAGKLLGDENDGGRLDTLARLAADLSDDEMSESVRAALRVRSARQGGKPASQGDIESLDLLIEWERRRL
jgi:hypothetical protein